MFELAIANIVIASLAFSANAAVIGFEYDGFYHFYQIYWANIPSPEIIEYDDRNLEIYVKGI